MLINILLSSTVVVVSSAIYCGIDKYVQRGALCCKPVFNCIPGYEVQPCSEMYGYEKCTRCPSGEVQPDYIDSYSDNRSCFIPKEKCTPEDLIPSRGREYCYPRYCKCNYANCYIDEHCVCVKHPGCPVNQTLHPVLNKCVDCPRYTFKDHFGCGPCITDILLINSRHMNHKGDNELPETDTRLEKESNQTQRKSDKGDNATGNDVEGRKGKCKKCKRVKIEKGRNNRRERILQKRKYRRCRRNRRRCLRRNKLIKNNTERRI